MRLDAALEETERRLAARDTTLWSLLADRVLADCHPEQADFVIDPARYLVGLVGRGGGKTTGGLARFVRRMLRTAGARCIYIAKTRGHAQRLLWKPLKKLLADLGFQTGVDVVYHETKMLATLPKNGASLQLFGANRPADIEALRGETFHEVGIDEAAYHPDRLLTDLIMGVFGPRLVGALWLIGTPGKVLKGTFYEVSRRGSTLSRPWTERAAHPGWKGWSFHKWSLRSAIEATRDRPIAALLELHQVQQDEIAAQGLSDSNPIKRREYDGEWAKDGTTTVFQYRIHNDAGELWNQWDPERVGPMRLAKLPEAYKNWIHILAFDLGYSDPTAINLFAASPSDPTRTIYHRYGFEATKMFAQTIAQHVLGEELKHGKPAGLIGALGRWPDGMTADSSHQMGEAILAELANVYSIGIEAAQKGFRYKLGAIDVVNGDFYDARIKVLKGSKLEEQLLALQWDENKHGALIERKGDPNHSTDTLIYARVRFSDFISTMALPGAPAPNEIDAVLPPMPSSRRRGDDSFDFLLQ